MARISLVFMLILFVVCSTLSSSSHARKLSPEKVVVEQQQHNIKARTPSFEKLYMAALPKGKVPASTPTKKGHAFTVDEKLIARHLSSAARILGSSIPSPGNGN